VNNPVTGGLLPDALLNQGLFRTEQLHRQLVVRRLEDVL